MSGFVYLVGAGPGDPGLLTLRAKQVLERAEAVIYDILVHTDILEHAPADAIKERMGKTGHGEQLAQDAITARLIELAKEGKRVVRLKGGDPCIFGRLGEEAMGLAEEGIPVEIIPGVTAASGAAAYAGFPLTHRDYAPCVTFVTGHRRRDGGFAPNIDWDALGKLGGTIAVYMGIKHLPEVVERLVKGGRAPETPVAVIHRATWPEQRTLDTTLGTVVEDVKRSGMKPPALVIVGEVTTARSTLDWFDKSPLKGKQVLVTRAAAQASELCHLLQERGSMPIELPLIELRPFGHASVVDTTMKKLFAYDWLVFSSANAVRFTFDKLYSLGLDARTMGAARVCAVGPKTAAELEKRGIRPDVVPPKYIAESLVEALEKTGDLKGKSILIPRAKEAREVMPAELERLGARVDVLPIYENIRPEPHPLALEVVRSGNIDAVTLASPSAATNYADLLKEEGLPKDFAPCIVIGPATRERAVALGLDVVGMPEEYTIGAMVNELERFFSPDTVK
jgi:uroporphyrinogen III methyltransferase/synthase